MYRKCRENAIETERREKGRSRAEVRVHSVPIKSLSSIRFSNELHVIHMNVRSLSCRLSLSRELRQANHAHHTKNNALEIQKRKIVLASPKNSPKRIHTTKHRPKRWIIVTLCAFVVARFSNVHATPKHPTNIKTNNDKSTLKINCCFTWTTIKIGVCFITLCATLSLFTPVRISSLSNDLTIG